MLEVLLGADANIHFISSASKNKENLSELKNYPQISIHSCNPNDEKLVNTTFGKIINKPDVTIFDTFISEEMFR